VAGAEPGPGHRGGALGRWPVPVRPGAGVGHSRVARSRASPAGYPAATATTRSSRAAAEPSAGRWSSSSSPITWLQAATMRH